MKLFVSSITRSFTIATICRELGMYRKNVTDALKILFEEGLISKELKQYRLTYDNHHQELASIEHERSKEFLQKKKNRYIKLIVDDVLDVIPHPSFIFILFGSRVVEDPKAHDVDLLFIVETKETAKKLQKIVQRVKSPLPLDIEVHWYETAYDMLQRRQKDSLLHEILNKHLIFHGAESFYRLLARIGK